MDEMHASRHCTRHEFAPAVARSASPRVGKGKLLAASNLNLPAFLGRRRGILGVVNSGR